MKILTKEEEEAHSRTTWEGGLIGGLAGAVAGSVGVWGATKRFQFFRQLSVPLKGYVVTATTAFGAVILADRYSRAFEKQRHADSDYVNQSESAALELSAEKPLWERSKAFVSDQRYPIVFGSWVASMGVAFGLVGRNKYLTGQQKLVQARVYAQGLTLAVMIASFALEGNDMRSGKGRWETIKVLDPNDPEHKRLIDKRIHHESYQGEDQWMDMLDAAEERMKARGHEVRTGGKKSGAKGEKEAKKADVEEETDDEHKEKSGEKKTKRTKKKEDSEAKDKSKDKASS